ncbi:MAG: GAF domain-containing protein [Desulfobacula sp.]|uniref:HD domain-containing phosphohydrolase n=1 Tax=Desulfobacula sp. TaxID=2593537 RepID=UPI0025BFF526|nr:HD domain-containing phosphohydrolase [Desulfobacula sp.]MCD4718668.1 GAF domain-containing protein [Desulfobacula sp.]
MPANGKFSENARINIVIENILDELCPFLEDQAREISELTAIGKALGTGKDISVLLEMILSIARRFTKADGGTLYLVDHKTKTLVFNVIHNESLNIKKGGGSIDLPGVPLYNEDNTPNHSNVSSYVFHTGRIVNIKNVYKTKRFQFNGIKRFDEALHYKSQSMIVIPMKNHEDDIIGILQLINSKNLFTNKTISFSKDDQEKATALASQASVILTQQALILEMKKLFEAFIKAIAVSIDEKSKHTGGHIQRVTELSMMIAHKINQDNTIFKTTSLSYDQMDELRIAALMHDTGKITTPEHIISKSTRLETVHDRIELIKTRWELFKTNQKLAAAQKKLALFDQTAKQKQITQINNICKEKIDILEKEFETLSYINSSKEHLNQSLIDQLEVIYEKSDKIFGKLQPCLTEDEFENLCILRGTLTSKERDIINNHAYLTEKILNKLPWPKKLANIPSIAGAHHEKLDGSGYPLHLSKKDLNLQARILAIADIFEALSARDRPYKNPMNLSKTVNILEQMGENGLLDKDIIKLFFKSQTHLEYAKRYLSQSQIDL